MSSAGCYKTTNNRYFTCPPRMADGRHFTDYRPQCDVNNLMVSNNRIMNSNEYRQFLIQNADSLMDMNRAYTVQMNSCGPCADTMLPEQSKVSCDANSCSRALNVLSGLGQGRAYSADKCGADWEFPKNVPGSCCGQSSDYFNYYNTVQVKNDNANYPRNTVVSGGRPLGGGDPRMFS